MATKPQVRLGEQYPNPDARSSGKAVHSSGFSRRTEGLKLAAEIARQVRMIRTWPNLQTIRAALESEAELLGIDLRQTAELIVECAKQPTRGRYITCPPEWEAREVFRANNVDRFWFEDARWRTKAAYWKFCEESAS